MCRTCSLVTKKLASVVINVVGGGRFGSTDGRVLLLQRNGPIIISSTAAAKLKSDYLMSSAAAAAGLKMFSTNSNTNTRTDDHATRVIKNVKVEYDQLPASPTSSSFFNFSKWIKWVLSSLFSLLLPFWKVDYDKLQRIEGKTEFVVEEVEKVANVVEKVAMVAEKVSEEVAENLPDNACRLKKVALAVECVSKHVVHDAQLTKEFIHKVEVFKNDLDCLESFIEPMIFKHQVVNKDSQRNSDAK